jgi:16S rRNA (uracil1498-N3)-methyltransferase
MRTDFQQFYVAPKNVHNGVFYLVDDEAKHAAKVLRKQAGDDLEAIDGQGTLYQGVIQAIEKNRIAVSIKNQLKNVGEPDLKLTIVQSVPKGNHFDLVIEKGTEIGVSAFWPILTQRSIVEPESRLQRWSHKVQAAAKQCGRSLFPMLQNPVTFSTFLTTHEFDLVFIAHQAVENAVDLRQTVRESTHVAVLIGPEGGFTDEEIQAALNAGCLPLNMGKRRLRSETAGLVAACKILSVAGELG